jgi:hypothetical protein
MNIENRVAKLEDRIGVNQEPETVEEIFAKFDRGEYGQHTTMGIVAACLSAPDKGQFFKSLRQHLPGPLVDVFQLRLEKVDTKMMEPDRA